MWIHRKVAQSAAAARGTLAVHPRPPRHGVCPTHHLQYVTTCKDNMHRVCCRQEALLVVAPEAAQNKAAAQGNNQQPFLWLRQIFVSTHTHFYLCSIIQQQQTLLLVTQTVLHGSVQRGQNTVSTHTSNCGPTTDKDRQAPSTADKKSCWWLLVRQPKRNAMTHQLPTALPVCGSCILFVSHTHPLPACAT